MVAKIIPPIVFLEWKIVHYQAHVHHSYQRMNALRIQLGRIVNGMKQFLNVLIQPVKQLQHQLITILILNVLLLEVAPLKLIQIRL